MGKVAARFGIVAGVALRGSASPGFRAPSLAQQVFATTSTNNVAGTLIEVGTFPVSNPVSVALGSKPLKAEKSTNLGGGIALNPISGLSLTADYSNIKVRDRVTLTDNLQDRKSGGWGTRSYGRVDIGGRRRVKEKKTP